MMDLMTMATEIEQWLTDAIKISRPKWQSGDIPKVLGTIDKINTLPKGIQRVDGYLISEYQMIKGWAPLIMPQYLSFGGTVEHPDLIKRPVLPKNFIACSPDEFNQIIHRILGSMRNQDAKTELVRPNIETFKAEQEYLIDGEYSSRDISLGMHDLNGSLISAMYNTDSHVLDIKSKYVELIALATYEN